MNNKILKRFNKLNSLQISLFKEYLIKNTSILDLNKICYMEHENNNYYKFFYALKNINYYYILDECIIKYLSEI